MIPRAPWISIMIHRSTGEAVHDRSTRSVVNHREAYKGMADPRDPHRECDHQRCIVHYSLTPPVDQSGMEISWTSGCTGALIHSIRGVPPGGG